MNEPSEVKEISSLIYKYYPEEDEGTVSQIKTVLPTRTFLEKLFLLHEEFQKPYPRFKRMSRHLYDLEKLMDTDFAKKAVTDFKLYREIVEHRAIYNAIKDLDYKNHLPLLINFLPNDNVLKDWESDYDEMKSTFIYGASLNFPQLINRMKELLERVRAMPANMEDIIAG